jgi:GAF domain-containing protein
MEAEPPEPKLAPATARALLEVARSAVDLQIHEFLPTVCAQATNLSGLSGAGISLVRGDRLEFACTDDPELVALERAQERYQHGPCIEAWRAEAPVVLTALWMRARDWPVWTTTARRLGVVSTVAVPLGKRGRVVGVLDLYQQTSQPPAPQRIASLLPLCDFAASVVEQSIRLHQQTELSTHLQRALDSRGLIEQAKGFLAAELGLDVETAFDRLRRHATDHRMSLREVATAVTTGELKLGRPAGGPLEDSAER